MNVTARGRLRTINNGMSMDLTETFILDSIAAQNWESTLA